LAHKQKLYIMKLKRLIII